METNWSKVFEVFGSGIVGVFLVMFLLSFFLSHPVFFEHPVPAIEPMTKMLIRNAKKCLLRDRKGIMKIYNGEGHGRGSREFTESR